jgi:hypothetical protein
MGEDNKDEVASTTVVKDDEGNIEATATTTGGSTGSGSSSPGIINEASPQAAVDEAVQNAK